MLASFRTRRNLIALVVCLLAPAAAWFAADWLGLASGAWVGGFFLIAAGLSAAVGGIFATLVAIAVNVAALNYFFLLHHWSSLDLAGNYRWTGLLVLVTAIIGYQSERRYSAQGRTAMLSSDLAALREELLQQRTDLAGFHELSVLLSSSLELQPLLQDVISAIAGLQKTDLAMLLLLPEASNEQFVVEASVGFTPQQIALFGRIPATFFPMRRRMVIEDIETAGIYFPFVEAAAANGLRAVFSTPLSAMKGEPLGVVVTYFRAPHQPSEREFKLVELYARQAAHAIENAHLYRTSLENIHVEQQRTALLRSLAEASLRINSSLSVDSLLQVITDQARSIIGAHEAYTTLMPRGSWTQSIHCVSVSEASIAQDFSPESSELLLLASSLNKPIRITTENARGNPWWTSAAKGRAAQSAGGWLAAPLITRDGRNLGLIQLSKKITGDFTQDDESILVQLAQMASVAIENVRLYKEAQEQIRERALAQDALQRSKESMHLAQQCVGIGAWEWDLQSGTLNWSDEISALHNTPAGSFNGKYDTWMQSIHPEDQAAVHRSVADAIANNTEYQVQYRVANPRKGVRWLEARGQAFYVGETPVRMLGVAMDITSRKQAEEALRNSEKLATAGRLAATIAHEINNPLAAVTNLLYILRSDRALPAAARENVLTAEAELARVTRITRQTLGFYRESFAPVETDIVRLLDETLAMYGGQIEHNQIQVRKRFRNFKAITAFENELRQVFSNVLLNAIEALPHGGTLLIHAQPATSSAGEQRIRISVADTGPGIAPEILEKVFEPFFTTKGEKGTGLGLWVTDGIVRKHGGTIRVRSSFSGSRRGTCVSVFLPAAEVAARSDGTAAA